MEQLDLFSILPAVTDPVSLLDSETDPGWLEDCLGCWDDREALMDYLANLKHDVMDRETTPDRIRSRLDRQIIHDLKDTIRIVSRRVRELQ